MGRADRILLGHLHEHRGRTVDELIEESVAAHLERSNFNSSTQVAGLLEGLGLDVEPLRRFFSQLDQMMRRRHQIVHRADCTSETGRGRHRAHSLSASTVEQWINVVLDMHAILQYQVEMRLAQNV
ncbi:MAG: hypothetical protein DWQ31_20000 [Planctomycetota bacterium]|nr:MAG: hypothetical protein DWQ31_20000 [Planctomycetota bacterium]REJ94044.1 MAG: hypothetical protein DWQ35_09190 [Planctomycetota bacterium]REK17857.1 MAG: hypothetical protein DWQ42_21325 [Planctomycetota bacterium]REK42398.1 MAG: hypothetical protein DWQ46_13475 [Planctomycetota bacterium]